MAPLDRGDDQYLHLQVVREPEHAPERRRRPGRVPGPPVPDNRAHHGRRVSELTTEAVQRAAEARRAQRIDPTNLLVLEFNSINFDLRRALEERFAAWVVDERKRKIDGQDYYRFLVQFLDEAALRAFQEELALYQTQSPERLTLPLGLRRNFFDGLQEVGLPIREDRIGNRLREEGFPDQEPFFVDVDLWHPGNEQAARNLLADIRTLCQRHGGQLKEDLRTSSLLLAKIHGSRSLADALLDLDLVARVDLPPVLSEAYSRIFFDVDPPDPALFPEEDDPLACVVDSGVVAGHPLLMNWVIEERDFDTGENTVVDLHGHGTSVAGLVVYGDVAGCIEFNEWRPKVRICSAKVLRHDPDTGRAVFPDEHRVERVIEEAIRHFVTERNCRVFNLSLGSELEIYDGGRQFPWAEKLDEIARELDVVIVVSAGNRRDPPIPDHVPTREQFQEAIRDQLLSDDQRICNPGTAALALTVGAIARSDALGHHIEDGGVRVRDAFAGSPAGAPSPFTRTGSGYAIDETKAIIKPDAVHYGGNYALQTLVGGEARWVDNHILLGEPTICREIEGRFVGAEIGTSFSCPHISHAAAIGAISLEEALGTPPSANLIRALIGSATVVPPCGAEWLLDEENELRLVGYGKCQLEDLVWSRVNRVRLIAADEIEENRLHLYRLSLPEQFFTSRGKKGIAVALAYDPPVRSSRKEYLARTMWTELLHGLTTDEVEEFRGRHYGPEPPQLPTGALINLRPPKTRVQWSTMQVRSRTWQRYPRFRIPLGEEEPIIHLLVGCQQRFPTGLDPRQRYGVVVFIWHEAEHVQLYQALQTRIRVPPVRIRVEP